MPFDDLFNGIAVVIDDQINIADANIQNILKQISKKNIPILKYENLPEESEIIHFQNISFLLLDWNLNPASSSGSNINDLGVRLGETAQNQSQNSILNFIKKVQESTLCPIFIFSNENTDYIKQTLIERNLFSDDCLCNILIQRKEDLRGRTKVFKTISQWISRNPSAYVFKEWEKGYLKSRNSLFLDFQKMSPRWPNIIWKCFAKDGVDKSAELTHILTRYLSSGFDAVSFDEKVMARRKGAFESKDVISVLEKISFSSVENGCPPQLGDVFLHERNYYLNIRPPCDLILREGSTTNDNIELYLIIGKSLTKSGKKKAFLKKYEKFDERDSYSIVFPVHDGKAVRFNFKEFKISSWEEFREKRIGRLLPPYITKIQQRFALYLHREGLPRIPIEAIG